MIDDKAVTGELAIQTAVHDYHFHEFLDLLSSENFIEILKQKHEVFFLSPKLGFN